MALIAMKKKAKKKKSKDYPKFTVSIEAQAKDRIYFRRIPVNVTGLRKWL